MSLYLILLKKKMENLFVVFGKVINTMEVEKMDKKVREILNKAYEFGKQDKPPYILDDLEFELISYFTKKLVDKEQIEKLKEENKNLVKTLKETDDLIKKVSEPINEGEVFKEEYYLKEIAFLREVLLCLAKGRMSEETKKITNARS